MATRARETSVLSSPTGYVQGRNPYRLAIDSFWMLSLGLTLMHIVPLFFAEKVQRSDGRFEYAGSTQVLAGVVTWLGSVVIAGACVVLVIAAARVIKGKDTLDEREDEVAPPELMELPKAPPLQQPRAAKKWPPRD